MGHIREEIALCGTVCNEQKQDHFHYCLIVFMLLLFKIVPHRSSVIIDGDIKTRNAEN